MKAAHSAFMTSTSVKSSQLRFKIALTLCSQEAKTIAEPNLNSWFNTRLFVCLGRLRRPPAVHAAKTRSSLGPYGPWSLCLRQNLFQEIILHKSSSVFCSLYQTSKNKNEWMLLFTAERNKN